MRTRLTGMPSLHRTKITRRYNNSKQTLNDTNAAETPVDAKTRRTIQTALGTSMQTERLTASQTVIQKQHKSLNKLTVQKAKQIGNAGRQCKRHEGQCTNLLYNPFMTNVIENYITNCNTGGKQIKSIKTGCFLSYPPLELQTTP